ncbi:hypothetical protein PVAND_014609 [Polypedilum vanderplanki]|uniref:Uncharacterized protein n=1 Tax=Polypedilum vanderplanki TaxID=319348 RepID=A0A9J6BA86_POLVA|nr:hypothetical protein PVAND_014609 [Polypedilum vanderplanki]
MALDGPATASSLLTDNVTIQITEVYNINVTTEYSSTESIVITINSTEPIVEENTDNNDSGLLWGLGPVAIIIIIVAIIVIGVGVYLNEEHKKKAKDEFPPLIQTRNVEANMP